MNGDELIALAVVLEGLCVLGLYQVARYFQQIIAVLSLFLVSFNEAVGGLAKAKPRAFGPDIAPVPAPFTSDESSVA